MPVPTTVPLHASYSSAPLTMARLLLAHIPSIVIWGHGGLTDTAEPLALHVLLALVAAPLVHWLHSSQCLLRGILTLPL